MNYKQTLTKDGGEVSKANHFYIATGFAATGVYYLLNAFIRSREDYAQRAKHIVTYDKFINTILEKNVFKPLVFLANVPNGNILFISNFKSFQSAVHDLKNNYNYAYALKTLENMETFITSITFGLETTKSSLKEDIFNAFQTNLDDLIAIISTAQDAIENLNHIEHYTAQLNSHTEQAIAGAIMMLPITLISDTHTLIASNICNFTGLLCHSNANEVDGAV